MASKTTKKRKSWDESYADLVAYHKEHGHCNVPLHNKHHPMLGNWVSTQRANHSSGSHYTRPLRQDRIARLEALGFVWANEGREKQWNEQFEKLKRYKEKHGDCLVPQDYKQEPKLGNWVQRQRMDYKQGTIRKGRKERLDELGFSWSFSMADGRYQHTQGGSTTGTHSLSTATVGSEVAPGRFEKQWNEQFERLVGYKEKHGNCLVPQRYKQEPSLGKWVQRQRVSYKNGSIRENRKEKLEKLGFVWSVSMADGRYRHTQGSDTTGSEVSLSSAKNSTATLTMDVERAAEVIREGPTSLAKGTVSTVTKDGESTGAEKKTMENEEKNPDLLSEAAAIDSDSSEARVPVEDDSQGQDERLESPKGPPDSPEAKAQAVDDQREEEQLESPEDKNAVTATPVATTFVREVIWFTRNCSGHN